jgi:hypothetical protein
MSSTSEEQDENNTKIFLLSTAISNASNTGVIKSESQGVVLPVLLCTRVAC